MKGAEAWLSGEFDFPGRRKSLCGSGLAREYGGSACINAECANAFASKPAPTLFSVVFINTVCHTKPCGSELARDEITPIPAQNTPPKSPKNLSPTALTYILYQATHPCAFAYNYARIRPLVRLVPGFYCLPATAHQWSGLVARMTSGCMSLIS